MSIEMMHGTYYGMEMPENQRMTCLFYLFGNNLAAVQFDDRSSPHAFGWTVVDRCGLVADSDE